MILKVKERVPHRKDGSLKLDILACVFHEGLGPKGYPTFVEERGLTSSSVHSPHARPPPPPAGSVPVHPLSVFYFYFSEQTRCYELFYFIFFFFDKQTCLFVRFGLPERKPKPSLHACSRTEPVQGPARDCSRRTERNCSVGDSSASFFNITEQLSSKSRIHDI